MSSETISQLLPDNKDISPSTTTTATETTTTTLEFKSNTNNNRKLNDNESDQEDFFASLEKSVSKHVYFGETSSSDNEEHGNEQEHSDIDLDENESSMNSELLDRVRLCQTLLNENNSRPAKTVVIERCPPTTVRVDSSDLITRCRDFLPLLTDSNQKLTEKSLAGEDIKIELDEDNDGPAIEMDLMFCPYGKTTANSSSSSSTSPAVSDHENKLGETIDLANIVKRKKRNKKIGRKGKKW